MYDDEYTDDLIDPYDGSNAVDDYGDDWPGEPRPRARSGLQISSRVWIALLVSVLVIGGGAGLFYYFRQISASPVDTTRSFYEALNRRDFETAVTYIDPANGISAGLFQNSENLVNVVLEVLTGAVLEEFGLELPDFVMEIIGEIEWEFQDMTYTLVEESGDRATVQANGRLFLSALGFELPTPWSIPHQLIRIDDKWYLSFGF
jgi:hypothetical protein